MIALSNISKSFQEQTILDDISFTIQAGERVSLIGPGGSGKTLILKILLGLVPPDQGFAQVLGVDLNAASPETKQEILKHIGMAFQQGGLFDFMSVRENLFFAMENMTQLTPEQMQDKTKQLLAAVKLKRTETMFPHELSGGMKRRVGIARALCTNPQIAIFDEPTSGLDPVTSTITLNMISDLATSSEKEKILLIATSNVEIAIRFAKRIILIHEGKIAADGNWEDLLLNGSEWVRNFLRVRFIGLDVDYVKGMGLPQAFINQYW